jgi:hypothetical protein
MNDDERGATIDFSFSFAHAALVSVALIPFWATLSLVPHVLIWGSESLMHADPLMLRSSVFFPLILVGIVVHESLHGVGFMLFGGVLWRDVRFGIKVKSLAAYAHTDSCITVASYRKVVALPAIVLGIVPVCIGNATGAAWLTLYGFLMLLGAGGDSVILWKLRNVSSTALVLNNPDRAGCWVLSDSNTNVRNSETFVIPKMR